MPTISTLVRKTYEFGNEEQVGDWIQGDPGVERRARIDGQSHISVCLDLKVVDSGWDSVRSQRPQSWPEG